MRLFILDTSPLRNEEMYALALMSLSDLRRKKAQRLKNLSCAAVSAGAGLLLDFALDEAGVMNREIITGEHGKPYLKSKETYFNLSHSGNVSVCAVCEKEVGVDVEKIRKADMTIAKRFFSPDECEYIEKSPDKDVAFTRIWTLKESFVKACGRGVGAFGLFCIGHDENGAYLRQNNVDDFEYDFFEYTEDGYLISICVRR